MKFFDGLDNDIKTSLMVQLKNLWTYNSVAIEGNTLTLGETAFVIREGLTVKGKPLKDHEEVAGHATAIDLIFNLVKKERPVTTDDLFMLHKAVQTERVVDIYKPVGNWKRESNRSEVVVNEEQKIVEYSPPAHVPGLMETWLSDLNAHMQSVISESSALEAYVKLHISFVHIHPFWDGNGRMARLLANLPVICGGFPPIVIPITERYEYIQLLANYQLDAGQVLKDRPIVRPTPLFGSFLNFCRDNWSTSVTLVDQAHADQKKRNDGTPAG